MRKTILIVFAAVLGIVTILMPILLHYSTAAGGDHGRPRALVADSLCLDYPNPQLIEEIVNVLQRSGYQVDLYMCSNVTMELYTRLTDYDLIILRVHGGKAVYIGPDGKPYVVTGLFTGMKWSKSYEVFRSEWLATRARPYGLNKTYLAVLPRFFDVMVKGRFRPGAVMVVASCYSLYARDIADTLARKGLSIFIGWPGPVTLNHMDEALLMLVKKAVGEGYDWLKAVQLVNQELGPDPLYNTTLKAVVYRG